MMKKTFCNLVQGDPVLIYQRNLYSGSAITRVSLMEKGGEDGMYVHLVNNLVLFARPGQTYTDGTYFHFWSDPMEGLRYLLKEGFITDLRALEIIDDLRYGEED